MVEWRRYLRMGEPERLAEIAADKLAGQREVTLIRNRCYMRAKREKEKTVG